MSSIAFENKPKATAIHSIELSLKYWDTLDYGWYVLIEGGSSGDMAIDYDGEAFYLTKRNK